MYTLNRFNGLLLQHREHMKGVATKYMLRSIQDMGIY